jgi:hypothetical protein
MVRAIVHSHFRWIADNREAARYLLRRESELELQPRLQELSRELARDISRQFDG